MEIQYIKGTREMIPQLVDFRMTFLLEEEDSVSEEEKAGLRERIKEYFDRNIDQDIVCYLAVDQERIVSAVFLVIIEKLANLSMQTGKIGFVCNVYTEPEYRRKGIAQKLIEWMLEESKSMDLSYVELKATKMGEPLYRKVGFEDEKSPFINMKYSL